MIINRHKIKVLPMLFHRKVRTKTDRTKPNQALSQIKMEWLSINSDLSSALYTTVNKNKPIICKSFKCLKISIKWQIDRVINEFSRLSPNNPWNQPDPPTVSPWTPTTSHHNPATYSPTKICVPPTQLSCHHRIITTKVSDQIQISLKYQSNYTN